MNTVCVENPKRAHRFIWETAGTLYPPPVSLSRAVCGCASGERLGR